MLEVERDNKDKDFNGAAVLFMPDIPAMEYSSQYLSVSENRQIIER